MRKLIGLFAMILSILISCNSEEAINKTIDKDENTLRIVEDHSEVETQEVHVSDMTRKLSLITIGTGIPDYSEEKANASTAIKYGDDYYIIDCGNGSYENLEASNFDFSQIKGIFFTHHHIDHTSDFFDLYTKCLLTSKGELAIVGPPRTSLFVEFYNDVFLDDVLYRKLNTTADIDKMDFIEIPDIYEVIGSESLEFGDLQIRTAEMSHTMYDLAYRFDVENQSIVISGDTSYDEDLINLADNADILVIDGNLYNGNEQVKETIETNIEAFYDYGGNFNVDAHLTFDDMVTIAIKANVKTLVITHYGETKQRRVDSSIEIIKESFGGEVIYASDMMVIEIEANTEKAETISGQTLDQEILSYPVVDTNQTTFYSNTTILGTLEIGNAFYGQDASYSGNQPTYIDNKDGTVTDLVTGLTWEKSMGEKMTYDEALAYADSALIAGYDDWRIPTIKELYSLIQFDGQVLGENAGHTLFIDTEYFDQPLGDSALGEREIDAQTWSSTFYVGETMNGDETLFGVNFIDGRIKGYPLINKRDRSDNVMYFRLVRGNEDYGQNEFIDNEDGTITDLATGLTWQQDDSNQGMTWEEALAYAENLDLANSSDWRLPNAKELQSIVDYNRSIQTSQSPAIDPIFNTTSINDLDGDLNYPYFWTSTTHLDGQNPYDTAVYIAFGEAFGAMNGKLLDVHGAGAQRSDPKDGVFDDYPIALGPQGDIRYVYNYVRCVRDN